MKRGGGNSQSMQSNAVFSTLRSGHHLDIEDPDPDGCVQFCVQDPQRLDASSPWSYPFTKHCGVVNYGRSHFSGMDFI
jgi:hypothetical protein